jgi:FkbM family methyltransferase
VSSVPHIELLRLRVQGVPAFVMAAETLADKSIVPCLRDHGVWEPAETLLLLRVLRPGMHTVDVGAHLGYHTLLMSHCAGLDGSVLAIEPEPGNYRLLAANMLLNDRRNVQLREVAVAESEGDEGLYLSRDNLGDHRLQPTPGRDHVVVRTTTLDALLGQARVDFIKLDTQGSESRILRGMTRLIQHNRPHLACLSEFAPGLLALAGTSIADFAAALEAQDARAFELKLMPDRLVLGRLAPLTQGLQRLAVPLAQTGQVDESTNILLFFGEAAEQRWLSRFRGVS